jgi:hypothetical protein
MKGKTMNGQLSPNEILEGNVSFRTTMTLPTTALIELVNQSIETEAIAYWVETARDIMRAPAGKLDYTYCYRFLIEADGETHEIDVNTIKDGIQLILNGAEEMIQARGYVIKALAENDLGYIDSDVLDQIIQAGLFGELIYG